MVLDRAVRSLNQRTLDVSARPGTDMLLPANKHHE